MGSRETSKTPVVIPLSGTPSYKMAVCLEDMPLLDRVDSPDEPIELIDTPGSCSQLIR